MFMKYRGYFRSWFHILLITAISPIMISCATQIKEFTPGDAEAAPYLGMLEKEYRDLASRKRSRLDIKDGTHFAAKAAMAGNGKFVTPDHPRDREIATDNFSKIWTAHERLSSLPLEVYTAFPRDAATAHASFDCWLEELEESRQAYTPGICESRWDDAIIQLECWDGCDSPDQTRIDGKFISSSTILFGFNSTEVSGAAAQAIIGQAAREAAEQNVTTVKVTGFTDRTGPADYNRLLAERRAKAVARALERSGIPSSIIVVEARGEVNPAIPTDDEVKLEANRRAEIEFFQ